jgi:hypothetical protein
MDESEMQLDRLAVTMGTILPDPCDAWSYEKGAAIFGHLPFIVGGL